MQDSSEPFPSNDKIRRVHHLCSRGEDGSAVDSDSKRPEFPRVVTNDQILVEQLTDQIWFEPFALKSAWVVEIRLRSH